MPIDPNLHGESGEFPAAPLRWQLSLLVFLAVVSLIGVLAGYYFHVEAKKARQDEWDRLSAIADLKAEQIASWYWERLGSAEMIAKTPALMRLAQEYLEGVPTPPPAQEFEKWMAGNKNEYGYSRVVLYNACGSPVMSSPAILNAKNRSQDPNFQAVLRSAGRVKAAFYNDPDSGEPQQNIRLDFWIPLGGNKSEGLPAIGAILMQTDPNDFLYPLIQAWPIPSKTAETILFRFENNELVYLSGLRQQQNTTLNFRRFLTPDLHKYAEQVLKGQKVIGEGLDYRGVPVLAAIRRVQGTPWIIAAKVDQKDIYAPLRQQTITVTAVLGLLCTTALLSAIALWRQRKLDLLKRQIVLEKQAERTVRDSEEKFRTLFETANDTIFLMNGGSFVDCNSRTLKTFGYESKGDLLRRTPGEFSPPTQPDGWNSKQKYSEFLNRAIGGHPQRFYWKFQRKDDSLFDADVSLNRVELRGRQFVQAVVRDITELKESESALRKAKAEAEEANQAKDRFIATLSHELRTPLTPVLLASTALEGETAIPEHLNNELRCIRRNVELEMKLIDDLLDATRISRGMLQLRPEALDVHACLHNVLEICKSDIDSKHLNVSLDFGPAPAIASADPARLQQVFWNILRNAVKFTPEKGDIHIRCHQADGRIRIEFSDTGIGIEPAVLPNIFNLFERAERSKARRFGGLGLGLSISKEIMDLHQGSLSAFSEGHNKGSTFIVEIASCPNAKVPAVSQNSKPLPSSDSRKILLVEDNLDTLRILTNLLKKWGYSVRTANSVKTAMEEAGREPFDLLISDIGLPDGSGLDIMRHVKNLYRVGGIAVSGFGTDKDIQQSHAAGFEEHLVKPINIQELSHAIQKVARGVRDTSEAEGHGTVLADQTGKRKREDG